jgi:hypothetical protein
MARSGLERKIKLEANFPHGPNCRFSLSCSSGLSRTFDFEVEGSGLTDNHDNHSENFTGVD